MARPRGTTTLTLAIGEGTCERKEILNFFVIFCKSAFRGILGRYFLVKLVAVASPIHLKITYKDMKGMSTTVSVNLEEIRWIKELVQEDILASMLGTEKNSGNIYTFDMSAREEEVRHTSDGEYWSCMSLSHLGGEP